MNSDKRSDESAKPKGPEFNYPELFQVASRRVAYFSIFHCGKKRPDLSAQGCVGPEYRWNEIEVEVDLASYQLPKVFLQNPLPERFKKRVDAGDDLSRYGKCRLLSFRTSFDPPGYDSRLTLRLAQTSYLDYLRSGEYLDHPLPTKPARTFRDEYAPAIECSHDFRQSRLTNICGVGVFLITSDNRIIVSRHTEDVDVLPNVFSYSASGTMDWNRTPDPFRGDVASNPEWLRFLNPFSQVARECREEVAHDIDPENTHLFGFGIDAKKLYFQFSFFEETDCSADEIIANAPSGRDYHKELRVQAVEFELGRIIDLIKSRVWEPAAEAALLCLCCREFGLEAVERAVDPVYVQERWKRTMLTEWKRRAQRAGELAVMSIRYPEDRLSGASASYVSAVMDFLGQEVAGKDVLEIGGGIGRLTEKIVDVAQRVTCVDCCPEMLERSRQRLGVKSNRVTYVCDFAQNYHPSPKHDLAICSLVMVHNVDDCEFKRLAAA